MSSVCNLDWMLSIPWGKRTRVKKDITRAEEVLNEDHYGLDKVKERIIEHLAVQQRAKKMKGPILCLVGPPGVGTTSLGKSIARATGREFLALSLGELDEAPTLVRMHTGSVMGDVFDVASPGRLSVRSAMKRIVGACCS